VFESRNPEKGGEEGPQQCHGDGKLPRVAQLKGEGEFFRLPACDGKKGQPKSSHRKPKSCDPDEGTFLDNITDHEDPDGHDDMRTGRERRSRDEVTGCCDLPGFYHADENSRDDECSPDEFPVCQFLAEHEKSDQGNRWSVDAIGEGLEAGTEPIQGGDEHRIRD